MTTPGGPIRVLELRSVWGTGGGPDKTILASAAMADRARFAVTVCYIRDARDSVYSIDKRAAALNIDYAEILERNSYDPRIWPALRKLVRDRKIDIVHGHDQKTDVLTWALARAEPVIPMSTAHGFAGRSRSELMYYAIEKRILATFPRVIAVSGPLKAELVRTGSKPDRVVVINNGIDPQVFARDRSARAEKRAELQVGDSDFVFGAVGRLEDEKRFDQLLEALAQVRSRFPAAVLAIVGEGSLRPNLERQISELGLGSAVRLLGHRQDVKALHSAFDAFIQSSEREGTPNAVLEAMALETPVIATDVGGTGELMFDGVHGLLIPRHDVAGMAAAMERLLSDPAAAAGWVTAARQRVETELSFDRRMRKVEQIYSDLIAMRGRNPQQ